MKPLMLAFEADSQFAARLASRVDGEWMAIEVHDFPDGESLVRLGDCVGRHVIIVCGGQSANLRALPLYFAAVTARELGARSVGLVSPYLAYLRQDRRFRDGEAVSARAYAQFLSGAFDWLVTVDPHLHRLATLDEVFTIPASAVSATQALAEWIAEQIEDAVIVGPDRESEQWVRTLATRLRVPALVCDKTRRGDRDVQVTVPDPAAVIGRTPVILDDVASSGHTLARTVEALLTAGARPPLCAVVHALFADGAEALVRRSGASRIVSTNTLPHATNAVDVSPLVAAAVEQHLSRLAQEAST